MRLWGVRVLGVTGSQMLMVALGWQMYELTGSAWDLGLVGLLQFAPALALVLVAGQAVDRLHRGRIVAGCLLVQASLAMWLTWATPRGDVTREALLVLSVVLGAVRAFQMPAQQALIPSLVPPRLLAQALAFGSSGLQGAIIAGPALGGMLFALGPRAVFGVSTALFAVAATTALTIAIPHRPSREPISWRSLVAGVSYVVQQRIVLGAISLDLFAVLFGGAVALLPMFAKDILGVGAVGLGWLRAAPAVGALVMSIVLTRRPIRRRAGPLLFGAVAVYGAATLVFGLSGSYGLSMLALAVGGGADMVSVVVRQTLVQLETPEDMRGRVSSVNSVFIGASNQLGEFESGATAAWLGPVGSVVLGGVGTLLVAALWWRWFPELSRRDALVTAAAAVPLPAASTAPSTAALPPPR